MLTYANVLNRAEQQLQDSGNKVFAPTAHTSELNYAITDGLKEIATFKPHLVDVIFKIESRTGTDVTGTQDKLTDTVKAQFVTSDGPIEKVIHNTSDNTWAVVESKDSDSILSLSADIMDEDENYAIYNIRCSNSKQIYIGGVTDYLDIDSVEYPVGTRRNFKIYGEVLEIVVDSVADSDLTADNLPNIDVLVRFAKPHKLCQLTDLVGQTHTEAAAGATTIQVKFFKDDEVIEEGDEFHIENHRATYTVTTGVTLDLQTSSGKPISFYPALEATATATEHDSGITFTRSTLKPQDEDLFINLVAARAAINKGMNSINQISTAIATLTDVNAAIGSITGKIADAENNLETGKTQVDKVPAIITIAETALGLIQGELNKADVDFATGELLINEINKGGAGAPTDYTNYASTALAQARSYADKARVNLQQAIADEGAGAAYSSLAQGNLSQANTLLNQAGGYMREITSRLSVATSSRLYQDWGERKLAEVLDRLRKGSLSRTKRTYHRD